MPISSKTSDFLHHVFRVKYHVADTSIAAYKVGARSSGLALAALRQITLTRSARCDYSL